MVKIFIEGKNKKVPESEFLRAILRHKGSWRWDDAEIWNLDAESLLPLKDFLLKNIR